VNPGNQANLVPADVEYGELPHRIGGREDGPHFSERGEIPSLHLMRPTRERTPRLGLPFGEILEAFACDDVHSGHSWRRADDRLKPLEIASVLTVAARRAEGDDGTGIRRCWPQSQPP
jgi:hypothetical protein